MNKVKRAQNRNFGNIRILKMCHIFSGFNKYVKYV